MRLVSIALALAATALAATSPAARPSPDSLGTFESLVPTAAAPLGDWSAYPANTVVLDSTVAHSGRRSARIERDAASTNPFTAISISLPVGFQGDTIELRGWLKFEDVKGWAGLWHRQDGRSGVVQFDNMQARNLGGTRDWAEYRVPLRRDPNARTLIVGALLVGTGRLWADDLRVLVDGKPLSEAPGAPPLVTVLDTDTAFVAGSRVELGRPGPAQAENLALLGKVWGFLKYHHPAVVAGKHHWDYDLFRVLPRVLAARDRAAACAVMADWVDSLGDVPACAPCVELPAGRPVAPRLAWLSDRARLGERLSSRLLTVYARRPKVEQQFYVSFAGGVGNPDFSTELPYPGRDVPDSGYRLLALFRFWNMVEYWFPYRDVMDEDWDAVLREFVPRLAGANTKETYATELMALIARAHDTHANLWSSLDVRPPRGTQHAPVTVRFAEGRAVVTGWSHARLGPGSGLQAGDVIDAVDGVPVKALVERWRPLYAASNEPTRLRDIAASLTRGEGTARLEVLRSGRRLSLEVARVPGDSLDRRLGRTHDRPGPAFRRLSGDVAYLRMGPARLDSVDAYFRAAAGAKLLVIDDRNYPSEFAIMQIGGHLVSAPTPFVKFTSADASNPGSFDWTEPIRLTPIPPYFEGAVAILVDEITQSSAEYHSLAFRARPGSFVVGSTTAGADGNVSAIPLPGGLRTMFSGIGVFWPDGRPTQRVGIVPDVVATPTIAGIAAGRDEVFEAAVRHALGRAPTAAELAAFAPADEPGKK